MNWNDLYKIRLNQYSDEFLTHEVVKLLIVKNILQKNHKFKRYQEIYTEYPVCIGKTCDVFHRDLRTKEVVFYEIQKETSKAWLETTKKAYSELNGDLVIIPLKSLSDSLIKLNEQIKELII